MLILDCECYPNYFLLAFLEVTTGKVRHFECTEAQPFDGKTVAALMAKYQTGSFNGLSYDLPLIVAAIMGAKPARLKSISDAIILRKQPAWRVMRDFELAIPAKWDHIDIIEVAPGQSGLKIYGGRMHAHTLQDLPIEPDEHVTTEQMEQLKAYCANDLHLTAALFRTLRPQLDLRVSMSKQYGQDLRSKSDAQIAETVILSEIKKITGQVYRAPDLPDGYTFSYKDPGFISYQTPELQDIFNRVLQERFTLSAYGQVQMPEWLRAAPIEYAGAKYQLGIGGIHSCEKSQFVRATDGWVVEDRDVASYYPNIILGQSLYPDQLGKDFITVYQSIVDRRLKAKKRVAEIEREIEKIEKQLAEM
jgi:DNA polymerase elongation subunit (family B)